MEVRNSPPESQTSDQSHPIQEIDGEGGSKTAGGPADADGGEGVEAELGNGGGGADMVKKKRGRPPRAQATKSPPAKMNKEEDEDVCFICFDGGSLVLCDRRGCPKAYHPACVKRDEAFFQSKAKWNCGWHICSVCQKAANHMCYTCTYSLCKGCIKKTDYICVRGDKGFCTFCMKTIMLIENGGQEKDDKAQVDFDDKTSWEYLFKVYWIYLKGKLSLTLDEITQAKNPWKGASTTASVIPSSCEHNGDIDLKNNSPDMPENLEATESKRRKTDEQISITPHKETAITRKPSTDERSPMIASKDWATKELLEFVAHMKNGDTSVLSQFDVQELMLEYIKRNNLRDPRKKSQILCDSRLKILFRKPRVGHFEMLKLLEFHFFINEDLPKNKNKNTTKHIDPDWNIDNMVTVGKEKRRRNHKKTEESAPQNKLDDYAAIDVHNMNLVYLRRKLMENLIEDSENFRTKVVGSIVRIRISASDQKHDMYRLVRVVGTSKVDTPYKVGSKSADAVLEVLNLDKKETVSIDTISNQDLSEDECRRLRQSMKCGLVKRFTVGEIQDKAVSLRSARLHDVLEAETLRLNNLRDRASEKGHKKSLREYVEKLQLLKTPEERERRLREIPEVHSDPKMSPDYETDEGEEYSNKEHGENTKSPHSGISRKITSSLKKGKDSSGDVSSRSWKGEGLASTKATERVSMKRDARGPGSSGRPQIQVDYNGSTSTTRNHNSASETSTSSYSMNNTPVSNDIELDKIWHYRDPSGKMQGPFCMVQLRKWSTTGYFPEDMRIWTNREDDSLLLNDVLKPQVNGNGKMSTDKVGIRIEGLTVRTTNLSPTQKPVDHEKPGTHGFTGQPSVQNWIASGATNAPAFEKSNESNMPDLASPTPAGDVADTNTKHVSSDFGVANANLVDLPSPTPKETTTCADEKVQTDIDKEGENVGGAGVRDPGTAKEWTGYSPTDRVATTSPIPKETTTRADEKVQTAVDKGENVGGVRIPETAKEWTGYSPTDRVATTSVNMDQAIPSSSPPSSQPAWQDVRETIEFSTLAEESVSDLLAEVDAMESQNGFPSPTSRSNNFVDDLFTGSFEEFSPTPDPCSRNDAFSSSGAMIHLPFQPTTHAAIPTPTPTPTTTIVATSQGGSNNDFDSIKWPETRETVAKDTSDVNNSVKADERERQSNASETSHDRAGGSNDHNQGEHTEPTTTKSTMVQSATVDTLRPSPSQLPQGPQSSANGLHKGSSRQGNMNTFGRPAQEIMNQIAPHVNTSRGATVGWDHHQQTYGGDSGYGRNGKPWIRQSSFGSVSGGNGGVGVYNRAPPKGQRVCKFYESGRCKKGASCNYWHP